MWIMEGPIKTGCFPDCLFKNILCLKEVMGTKKLPQLKVASTPGTEEYFWDEHMRDSWVIWKSVA